MDLQHLESDAIMYAKKNEIDSLVCKIIQKHQDKTYLTWGIRTVFFGESQEPSILMFFRPNNDPKGSVIIEKTITELQKL